MKVIFACRNYIIVSKLLKLKPPVRPCSSSLMISLPCRNISCLYYSVPEYCVHNEETGAFVRNVRVHCINTV